MKYAGADFNMHAAPFHMRLDGDPKDARIAVLEDMVRMQKEQIEDMRTADDEVAGSFKFVVDKTLYRIRYVGETEAIVTVIIEPKPQE